VSIIRTVETAVLGAEPVSLADMLLHLRLTGNAENDYISALITAARMQAEQITHRAIIKKSFKASIDGAFGGDIPWWDGTREISIAAFQSRQIQLPYPPCISVDKISVFSDTDVETVALPSTYYIESASQDMKQRVILRRGAVWPIALRVANGMEILYTAGYADGMVPQPLVTAIKMLVTHLYQTRGDMSDTGNTAAFSGAAPLLAMYTITEVC
jgi:uncharacterized phiE125 gp8 family phage protein